MLCTLSSLFFIFTNIYWMSLHESGSGLGMELILYFMLVERTCPRDRQGRVDSKLAVLWGPQMNWRSSWCRQQNQSRYSAEKRHQHADSLTGVLNTKMRHCIVLQFLWQSRCWFSWHMDQTISKWTLLDERFPLSLCYESTSHCQQKLYPGWECFLVLGGTSHLKQLHYYSDWDLLVW